MLFWIDRLLQAPPLGVSAGRVPCVPKDSVGRTALFNLLRSNLDMFSVCVDRCYDRDPRIATGSFQVGLSRGVHTSDATYYQGFTSASATGDCSTCSD